jgi:hypothetical protein
MPTVSAKKLEKENNAFGLSSSRLTHTRARVGADTPFQNASPLALPARQTTCVWIRPPHPRCRPSTSERISASNISGKRSRSRCLLLAHLPGQMDLLREGHGSIIVRDLTRGRAVGARERDPVVDVEDAVGPARAEDVAGRRHGVDLGVHLAGRPLATAADAGARGCGRRGILAEVVGTVEGAQDARFELRVAVVRAVYHGELESSGVLEVQVQLAVARLGGRVVAGPNVGLETVKAKRDDLSQREGRKKTAPMSAAGLRSPKLSRGKGWHVLRSCRPRYSSTRCPEGIRFRRTRRS